MLLVGKRKFNEMLKLWNLTKALGQVGLLINEDLGRDNGAKGLECRHEVRISELLRKVVDE